jgi:hypothetical protein
VRQRRPTSCTQKESDATYGTHDSCLPVELLANNVSNNSLTGLPIVTIVVIALTRDDMA